jgi:hypothetical protein
MVTLSPGITISTPSGSVTDARHVRGPEVKLRTISVEKRRMTAAFFLVRIYASALNFVCGVIDPGLATTCPRSTSSRLTPRSNTPMLSPASLVQKLAEHLNARANRLHRVLDADDLDSSFTLTIPRSTRPVTTVPRPEMLNTSSIGIRNGLSMSRTGSGT